MLNVVERSAANIVASLVSLGESKPKKQSCEQMLRMPIASFRILRDYHLFCRNILMQSLSFIQVSTRARSSSCE